MKSQEKKPTSFARYFFWILPASLTLGGLLVLPSPGETWWIGWLAFSLVLFLGLTALSALWRWAGASRTLAWALAVALVLRLALGITFSFILPEAGNDSEPWNAGYFFLDPFRRDTQAWDLAGSDQPLWRAFDKSYSTDQYGGLLALSAFAYRSLSPDVHRPLLIVAIAALTAVIGLAPAWKAVARLWGERTALIVVWILALYPESLLQGASQMREPFLTAFLAMLFWGLVAWQFDHQRRAWPWMAGGVLGLLLVSPGVAVFGVPVLGIWAWLCSARRQISGRTVLIAAGVILAGLVLLWLGLSVGNLAGGAPLAVLSNWLRYAGQWEAYQAETSSGWLQTVFEALPSGLHAPFLTGYGILQPVLPAALVETTIPLSRAVGVLRALGWYALLPLLVFSLRMAWKGTDKAERGAWIWLWLSVWAWILVSAFRAGGDMWDNPRYRSIFLLLQALLAARAWLWWRESRNPWFGRILAIEGVFVALFLYWYVARYTGWTQGQVHFFVIAAAIAAVSLSIIIVGLVRDRARARHA
jgi:hypothetical protein